MNKLRAGFTLIELIVVIAIVSFLTMIVLVSLNSARGRGKDSRVISDVQQTRIALEKSFGSSGYHNLSSDGSYVGSGDVINSLNTLKSDAVTNGGAITVVTNNTNPVTAYAIYGQLVSDPSKYFCIASDGSTQPAMSTATAATCNGGGTGGNGGGNGGTGGSGGDGDNGGGGGSPVDTGGGGNIGGNSCGNGIIDSGEQCDPNGPNLAGQSCASVLGSGYSGTLGCSSICSFDTTGCSISNSPEPSDSRTITDVQQSKSAIDAGYTGAYYQDLIVNGGQDVPNGVGLQGGYYGGGPNEAALATLMTDANNNGGPINYVVSTDGDGNVNAYALYGELISDSSKYYCVDSTGDSNSSGSQNSNATCNGGSGAPVVGPLIPDMTSDSAPSGFVSASETYPGLSPWWAFSDSQVGWFNNGTLPCWIQYQFSMPKVVVGYRITPWSADSFPQRSPSSWTLQVSNDGITWTNFNSQTIYSSTEWTSNTPLEFSSPNSTPYTYYRLYLTGNFSNAYTGIRQFQLLGY